MKSLVIASALAGGLVCAPVAAQGLVEWQEHVISGVCTLRFAVPEGWNADTHTPAPGAVQIRIVPRAGSRAEVLVTGLAPRNDSTLKSTGDIKNTVRTMGEALLSGAVETTINLQRLHGVDGSGFFYSVADKRPDLPEGEYRFMTQGVMAVGPLRLGVTVLADQKSSPAGAMAFELLRTMECATTKR
ncbi:MAG: hypothetical protein LAO05_09145 [Acidobacteriia bacterium]|nr:hypothetical protein [Terriglobia bacterium]